MKIISGSTPDPDTLQKIDIIEMQVRYEFKEELERTSWWKKFSVEIKIKKEIKRRVSEKFGSDYIV